MPKIVKISLFSVLAAVVLAGGIFSLPAKNLPAVLAKLQPAAGKPAIHLAAHKALYRFRLTSVRPGTGLTGLDGEMFYKYDNVCDAHTTDQRFSVTYYYADQSPMRDTSHYVSWESLAQNRLYFSSERRENGRLVERLKGSAKRTKDGGGHAEYKEPEELHYDLPKGFLLPTGHTLALIRHAEAGDHFFKAVVFDGSDADGPAMISAYISKPLSRKEILDEFKKNKNIDLSLLKSQAWDVRLAVFPLKDINEMQPAYEMQMVLHANGVSSHISIDYRNFSFSQDLIALEKLPAHKCR